MLIKTKILSSSACLLIAIVHCVCGNGQTDNAPMVVDVKYWTEKGDTLSGKALYMNQYNLQMNLVICDTAGQPVTYFFPRDLAGFIYTSGLEKIEFNSVENPVDIGRQFLRLIYRGNFTLYQLLEVNYNSTILNFNVSYFLRENKKWVGPPITPRFEREALLYHFSQCPELEYKIKTGEYRLTQIRTILQEFENCQLTDAYEFFYE